jgi:uncharacterized protein (DUF1800 family)
MLFWLDGRTNVRAKPQENFARELMELFTMGVDTFAESDVYAGARVFTGWNLARPGAGGAQHYTFSYVANNHETTAKEFTFPIYPNGSRVIPARAASAGMQDGIDLLNAVAGHPKTGPRLARKLYGFFINEADEPDPGLIDEVSGLYYSTGYEIAPMVRRLLLSSQFRDPANYYKRYSWPAEFVVRALKEVGWTGFSVGDALTPLTNMGQQLLEPPDVSGWHLGRGWFSTGADARAHELRVAARHEPEVRAPRSVPRRRLDARVGAVGSARPADARRVRFRRAGGADRLPAIGRRVGADPTASLTKVPGLCTHRRIRRVSTELGDATHCP